VLAQLGVARFIRRSLNRDGSCCGNSLLSSGDREIEIGRIDAHERLTQLHDLSGIDEAQDHLASHAEAEIALDPRGDHPGVSPLDPGGRLDFDDLHETIRRPRIGLLLCLAGGKAEYRECGSNGARWRERSGHRGAPQEWSSPESR
jgi:hypothetical protein